METEIATVSSVAATLEADLENVRAVLANPSADKLSNIIKKYDVGNKQQVL